MLCFPNSDYMIFSKEFALFLFINYAHICKWMQMHRTTFWKRQFYGVPYVVWKRKQHKQARKKSTPPQYTLFVHHILYKLLFTNALGRTAYSPKACEDNVLYKIWATNMAFNVEPPNNEGSREWQNLFTITGVKKIVCYPEGFIA